ncbi:glutamyl-tRNA amidotransferas-like protein [Lophiotrema nucula]|uniref:Glutamyl-tRNA(Gln) amidotransferase subunit A, mitochondrial n=1 Tax=Lophiotrema nucula TaxID=690887 RepID=A0A6A5ZBB3_9PLEO|nr:glutamyl-tRNA amidotransferas-like protein [Lophiotrema nucula]
MSIIRYAEQYLARQLELANLRTFTRLPDRDFVLDQAKAADQHAKEGDYWAGRVLAIKDNICTKDMKTTAASGILKDFTSPYDATVVKLLRDARCIIAGKTNMDEFGMGSHSTHSHFGPVQSNSEQHPMSAGGSSGGSALAVATNQCWAALGTDTGGSVRLPAAYNGILGFKPSYGLLSRWGVIAYANSLDTVGIFSASLPATQNIFEKLNQYDPQDPTSLPPSTRARLGKYRPKSLRIGVPLDYNISTLHPAIRRAWMQALKHLAEEGHRLCPVSLPATRHALSAYYVLAPAEASSNLAKYDGVRYGSRAEGIDGTPESVLFAKTRGQGFGAEVQRRILLGAFSLSAQAIDNYFIQAQKVRRLVQQDFDKAFRTPNPLLISSREATGLIKEGVDVLVCPTAPTPTPTLASVREQDPITTYTNDVFTVPASLAGLPALSVPVAFDAHDRDQYPELFEGSKTTWAGLQIIGQYGDDELVLHAAKSFPGVDKRSSERRTHGISIRTVEER